MTAPDSVRYDCPFCDWYTNPAEGGTRGSAYQQIGGHILGIHGRQPAELVHHLVRALPNRAGAPLPVLNAGDVLRGEVISFARITTASAFTLASPDGRPLVTFNLATGEMTYGPGYTPDAAAEAFWAAVDQMEMTPVRRDVEARAAKERAWALVGEWRAAAVARGEDPYRDPHAQALAAALIGTPAADPGETA